MTSIFIIKAQSFDIYNNTIQLNDMNYNINTFAEGAYYGAAQSVKIENTSNELLDPIIKLNSSEQLKLTFDIINNEAMTYAYTFIHCDHNWDYSNITQSEYLEGFFDHYINDYEYSFNTLSPYIHYEFIFPNQDIQFKKSGNYVVLVYDSDNNIPILTKRFMVQEELLSVSMNVKIPILAQDRKNKQEIDFYIEGHKQLNITDPNNELEVIIQKNDNWNDVITNCKPSFISNNLLEYDYQGSLSFLGGNEYRDFDIKSLRYLGKNIKSAEQKNIQGNPIYYVEIIEDYIDNSNHYEFKYDLNGKYILSVSETKNKDTEGDYALVKFTLQLNRMINQSIYIYGELTNWNILNTAKMIYNEQEKNYYGFLYLKQGYYNYQYVTADTTKKNIVSIEGDYSETRNQYSVYIYHTPLWSDYDRLIGVAKSTSNALN
tara:strand:- start:11 stop:1303 length:1293 start_codon:yes stop_codon:yes gene_type:complete